MGHSKQIAAIIQGHSKDKPLTLEQLARDVVNVWGLLEARTLREAPPAALVGLAIEAVLSLAQAELLTVDQSADLQGRIHSLEARADYSTLVSDDLPTTLYEALSHTLPDPTLVSSWNVLLTALVAAGAVLGATVTTPEGADVGAAQVLVAWLGWLEP